MKFVTYLAAGDGPRAGLAVDGRIVDLEGGAVSLGGHLPATIVEFLRQGEAGMALAQRVAEEAAAGRMPSWDANDVKLLAAVPNPPTIFLLAGNYQAHIVEGGGAAVEKEHITPRPFIKPGTAVIGNGDPIAIPGDSDTVDYELEIAAVIGRPGKNVPVDQAENYVAGYVVFNDVSARGLKIAEGRKERNGDWFFDWLLGKWCDSFASVGPYRVTRDEAGDPRNIEMALRVNGELKQHSSAGEMIFTIPETIAFLTRFVTIRPGDLICMGTPGGVGATTQTYLKPGDVVEAEIEGLGKLTNTVEK
jgi:2-keto-4-pentenoate hydratase/2-oxohepta-3-ene-1,7-dioic acid hydratase in catechol pathway